MDDESRLVERCLQSDDSAIRELMERFHLDVFRYCVSCLRNVHDAEDMTQEVFLRIFRSLHRWDATRTLKPWILTITVNRCRTLISQRKRIPTPVEAVFEQPFPGEENDRHTDELLDHVDQVLQQLRPEYRETFLLFHQSGQSYETIASVMQKPVGTIKTWLHRTRNAIFQRFQDAGLLTQEQKKE